MKKNVFYLIALVCAMCLFVSCGNDDENNDDKKIDPFGTYSGDLSVVLNLGGTAQDPVKSTEKVQLVKGNADNKFSFVLKNFIFGTMNVGNIIIDDIELVPAGDNRFTFSKTVTDFEIPAGDKEGVTDWMGPIIGKINLKLKDGVVEGNKVTVKLDIPVTYPASMDVSVSFTGTK